VPLISMVARYPGIGYSRNNNSPALYKVFAS
jgi:hypothetical protein